MPDTLFVSHVDNAEKAAAQARELFIKGRYEELARSIGIYSILIDPEHTRQDQEKMYRSVLDMIKNRISTSLGKSYGAWLSAFPKLLSDLVAGKQLVTDTASIEVIQSYLNAFGSFRSLDDFYFWALDDRRLTLEQIVRYIDKTVAMHR